MAFPDFKVLVSINVLHGCRMFSDDHVAERLRPDVRKIVFSLLNAADSPPVRLDFILQPQSFFRFHVGVESLLLLHR